MGDPSVETGVSKPCVVVGDSVAVAVAKPLLVPRTGGVAVMVAQMEELPATHWPFWQMDAGPQQVLPH